jgi:6-phosphofructokinase 2
MKTIVTLTMNPAIDKSSTIDRVVSERKLRCTPPVYEPGGGGINVSRVIRRLGGTSHTICAAGGPTGKFLDVMLRQECLDFHMIPIEGMIRENLIVYEKATGLQFRFGMPGPILSEEEVERCLHELTIIDPRPDYIIASGSLPQGVPSDFYACVARIAKDLGSRLIVDTSKEPLRLAVREGVYLVKPNLAEIEDVAGHKITDESEIEERGKELIAQGKMEVYVASLGAGGALMVSEQGIDRIPSPTVPIRSKVGAGDSMVAAMVMSLALDRPLQEAVRFGVAAGAAAVTTPGTELARRDDVERLYQRMVSTKP